MDVPSIQEEFVTQNKESRNFNKLLLAYTSINAIGSNINIRPHHFKIHKPGQQYIIICRLDIGKLKPLLFKHRLYA